MWRSLQRRWAAPETARATQQEFAAVARIGVQGFPTAVVRIGEQGYVLARGYQPYEQLRAGPGAAAARGSRSRSTACRLQKLLLHPHGLLF